VAPCVQVRKRHSYSRSACIPLQTSEMVCRFFCSKYDLYSKSSVRIDVEKVKPYYMSLIEKVQECRESPIFYLLTASLQHCQKAQNIF
jgi:hypothetical protein